jgi:hypothetical protein
MQQEIQDDISVYPGYRQESVLSHATQACLVQGMSSATSTARHVIPCCDWVGAAIEHTFSQGQGCRATPYPIHKTMPSQVCSVLVPEGGLEVFC